jgi:hypothetical protein
MNLKRTILASAAVVTLLSGTAMAGLTSTTLDLELVQSGFTGDIAGPSGGTHLYGTTDTFILSGDVSWDATSPAPHPDFENSMVLDFTNFQYASFAVLGPSMSTFDATGLAEQVEAGSVHVFLPADLSTDISISTVTGTDSFSAVWDVETVTLANPVNPSVVVAWNSVPAPGSIALLGLAGVIGRRRPRRS